MRDQFVFGYGSLAAERELGVTPTRALRDDGFVTDLPGFARSWGVALDNRIDLAGYKYYTASDGTRPAVLVSFLDVAEDDDAASVNGVCQPVDPDQLAALDRRERNYARVDVSDRIDAHGARVWAYVGTPEARERLRGGRDEAIAVIAAPYLRSVQAAFRALGHREHTACRASVSPGELPVLELTRNDLP